MLLKEVENCIMYGCTISVSYSVYGLVQQ